MRSQGCSRERWTLGLGAPVVCNSPCLPVDRGCGQGRAHMGYTGVFCHLSPGHVLFPSGSWQARTEEQGRRAPPRLCHGVPSLVLQSKKQET